MNVLTIAGALILLTSFVSGFSFEKPLNEIPNTTLKALGNGEIVTCEINGYCEYKFKILNNSATDSMTIIKPYFKGKVDWNKTSIQEITYTTKQRSYEQCQSWTNTTTTDLNGEKVTKNVCESYKTITQEYIEETLTPITSAKSTDLKEWSIGIFESKNAIQKSISGNGENFFKIRFKPLSNIGELAITAVDLLDETKTASIDPPWSADWASFKVLKVCANAWENADSNYLTPFWIPLTGITDANDVRLVYKLGANDTEFPYYQIDWNTMLDTNLQGEMRLPFPIKAGECTPTTDVNGSIKVYYNNASQSTRPTAKTPWDVNYQMDALPVAAVPAWTEVASVGSPLSVLSTYNDGQILMNRNATNRAFYSIDLPDTTYGVAKVRLRMETCSQADDGSEYAISNGTRYSAIWLGNYCKYIRNEADAATAVLDLNGGVFHTFWIVISDNDVNVYVDANLMPSLSSGSTGGAGDNHWWYFNSNAALPTRGVWDYVKHGRTATAYRPLYTELQEQATLADFNYKTVDHNVLDAENGVNSLDMNFSDISTLAIGTFVKDRNWFVNGVLFSNGIDKNEVTRTFSSAGDYNIMLRIKDNAGTDSNVTKSISVKSTPQGLAITWSANDLNAYIDVNFSFSTTSLLTDSNQIWKRWVNGDLNQQSIFPSMRSAFAADGNIFVCVNVSVNDVNKTACATYYATRVLVKIPKDEVDLNNLIPYQITVSSNVAQDYNIQTLDKNIFLFDFTTSQFLIQSHWDGKSHYPRTYTIDADVSNTVRTLQAYLVPVSGGINPIIQVYDYVTKQTIANVRISVKRQIAAVLTEILSLRTDDKGEAQGHFVSGATYYFDVNYFDYYKRFEIRPLSATTIIVYLDVNYVFDYNIRKFTTVTNTVYANNVAVTNGSVPKTLNNYAFQVGSSLTSDFNWTQITNVVVKVYQNGGLKAHVVDSVTPFLNSISIPDSNVSATLPLSVEITVTTNAGVFKETKTLTLRTGTDRIAILKNIKMDVGQAGTMFLALAILIVVVAFFHQKVTDNTDALGFLTAGMIGLFAWLEWLPAFFFWVAILLAVFLTIRRVL